MSWKQHKLISVLFLVIMLLGLILLSGCTAKAQNREMPVLESLDEVNGCRVGVSPSDSFGVIISKAYPDCELVYFSNYSDMIPALLAGQIDAYAVDMPVGKLQMRAYPNDIYELPGTVTVEDYAFAVSKDNQELTARINALMETYLSDGTLQQLRTKWIDGNDADTKVEYDETASTENGTLRFVTSSCCEGFTYYQNGELQGLCIDLAVRLAQDMHMEPEFIVCDWSGILPSIQSGKADVAADALSITEERKQSVDFCTPFYQGGTALMVRAVSTAEDETFLESVKDSFVSTFVVDARWKMILSGLLVTFELALYSALLGTVVGFFFSFALRSKRKWLRKLSDSVSNVLSCMPMVVILMVLYYIIFSKAAIPAKIIAVIGFTMTFGNTVAGLLNTGVHAVSSGQIEAATALGYRKFPIFTKIILPQATTHMFAQYKGSIIGLIKETAVVGYITIEDLTRVSDIIRGRTYEAFFPLIATAVIYFLLCKLFLSGLYVIDRKLQPQNRKNVLRGVKTK